MEEYMSTLLRFFKRVSWLNNIAASWLACYYSIDCRKWDFKGVGGLLGYVANNFLLLCYSVFIVVTLVKGKTLFIYDLVSIFFLKKEFFDSGQIDIILLLSSYDNLWPKFLSNLFSRVSNCHYVY